MPGKTLWKGVATQASTNSLPHFQSFNKNLLCAYNMSGTVLGTGDKVK